MHITHPAVMPPPFFSAGWLAAGSHNTHMCAQAPGSSEQMGQGHDSSPLLGTYSTGKIFVGQSADRSKYQGKGQEEIIKTSGAGGR
jgi:hypothetical protein